MINLNRLFSVKNISILLLILFASCRSENSYEIKVYSSLEALDKQKIELRILDEDDALLVLSESTIRNGKAVLKGEIENPTLGELYIDLDRIPYIMPIVVEAGAIYAKLDSLTVLHGTDLNNRLHQMFLDKEDFLATVPDTIDVPGLRLELLEFYRNELSKVEQDEVLSSYIKRQIENL